MPDVASFALIAPDSFSYSTNAMPFLPGTIRISLKPGNLPNIALKPSASYVSGSSLKNRILFGGKYSSGTTGAAAVPVGLSPVPFCAFVGRESGPPAVPAAPAGRFSFFWASRASCACLRSVDG